ncbi:MAG: hypothetical protein IIA66_00260 [Planctomycetes bacterium]|nr:hypothetical protein [Planctomycetota bacterium]
MGAITPKSFVSEVGDDLVCYDLEFGSGEVANIGYEFHHTSGLSLTIDVDTSGDPLAMTLIHKKGIVTHKEAPDYTSFVTAAEGAYAFAKLMIAFAEAQKQLLERRISAEEQEQFQRSLQDRLFKMVRRAESYGSQQRAA